MGEVQEIVQYVSRNRMNHEPAENQKKDLDSKGITIVGYLPLGMD